MQQQQGDVTIELAKIPKSAKKLNHLTLAEGETTGHAHRITGGDGVATLYEEKGSLYLSVVGGSVVLTHEEHTAQTIPVGEYRIGRVLEYDYDTKEAKAVRD